MVVAGGGMAATFPRFLPRAPLINSEARQLGPLGKVTAVGWRVPLANAVSHGERAFMTSKPGVETRERQHECCDWKRPNSFRKMEIHPHTAEGYHIPPPLPKHSVSQVNIWKSKWVTWSDLCDGGRALSATQPGGDLVALPAGLRKGKPSKPLTQFPTSESS